MKYIARTIFLTLLLILAIGTGQIVAQEDVAQANKALVRSAIEAFNAGSPESFINLFPEEFLMNQGTATLEPMLRTDVAGYLGFLQTAMPDMRMEPVVVIAQGDWVVTQLHNTGTFTQAANFGMPLEPTNEVVTWTEMNFLHLEDGQVIELWVADDPTELFGQLGTFPAQEGSYTGTPVELPAGYQTLSAEELANSLTSGMEARNAGLIEEMIALGPGGDNSPFYADPHVSWGNGIPYSVTAEQVKAESAFPAIIAAALPDQTIEMTVTVAEGDWTASLITISGTFTEDIDFFGTPLSATDETITWQIAAVNRFDTDGKIIEEWIESDASPLLIGLGIMPAPDQ